MQHLPDEIVRKTFLVALRGYHRDQVEEYLLQVAEDYAAVRDERDALRGERDDLQQELDALRRVHDGLLIEHARVQARLRDAALPPTPVDGQPG